jgi:hypothetical protein
MTSAETNPENPRNPVDAAGGGAATQRPMANGSVPVDRGAPPEANGGAAEASAGAARAGARGSAAGDAPSDPTGPDHASSGPRTTQVKLAQLAVGTAVIAGEQVRGGVRSVGGRTASVMVGLLSRAVTQTEQARDKLFEVMDDAERRGRETLAARRQGAASLVNTTVGDAMSWAQVKVVPQFIDDLVPHLISDVMPRLIDGALPEIRDRVVPVIIEDLTTDSRVEELVMAQSRGVIGQLAEQLRTNSMRADDRLEAAAHRVVGRDKSATAKGLNEIRGV